MYFSHTLVALYAVALAGFAAAQGGLTVATPASIVQCQPAQLSWSGGTAPYFPSIIPGSQPGAAALKEFPSQTGTTMVWTVDLAQGTSVTIQVRDSTGTVQYSSAITIQNSNDASCLNGSASTGAPGASTAPATSPAASSPAASSPAASSPAASNTAPSTSRPASSAAASSAGSTTRSVASTASATAKPNSASSVTTGAFGVAAFAGLVGAALF